MEDQKKICRTDDWESMSVRIHTLQQLLHEVSCSGVELQDERMSYVVVQIDAELWREIQAFRMLGGGGLDDVQNKILRGIDPR